jgi:hypothetical protein
VHKRACTSCRGVCVSEHCAVERLLVERESDAPAIALRVDSEVDGAILAISEMLDPCVPQGHGDRGREGGLLEAEMSDA